MPRFALSTLGPMLALAGGLTAGAIVSLSVAAAERPTLEALDINKDGMVSLNEASANDSLFVAFKQLDTNKDGLLSSAEFAAWTG